MNLIIIDCIAHTEDCLKKAMDVSSPLNKSSSMIAELYEKVQLLQSQLEVESCNAIVINKNNTQEWSNCTDYIEPTKVMYLGKECVAIGLSNIPTSHYISGFELEA